MTTQGTILIVEDDNDLLRGVSDVLELKGHAVMCACNGVDALHVLHTSSITPDLIVSDIRMPEMDGYELFEAVRREGRFVSIPFIFLTAKGERQDIRHGKSLGVDDYLVKPFDAEDFLIMVDTKLRRYRQLTDVHKEGVEQVKRAVLTILNHEFRTPLTYIVAYADMLNYDVNTDNSTDMKTFLEGISTGAERIRRLIENFILLVELQTDEAGNTYQWRKQKLNNYDEIIQQAIIYVKEKILEGAKERKLTLLYEPQGSVLPYIMGDIEYLRVALIQLIDNAVKFSEDEHKQSVISIQVKHEDGYIVFEIKDNGRGIPIEEQEKIFAPFYQIDRPRYEDQGTGSGLAIVQRIAQLHNGYITVQSTPEKGSTFTLSIPVVNLY